MEKRSVFLDGIEDIEYKRQFFVFDLIFKSPYPLSCSNFVFRDNCRDIIAVIEGMICQQQAVCNILMGFFNRPRMTRCREIILFTVET